MGLFSSNSEETEDRDITEPFEIIVETENVVFSCDNIDGDDERKLALTPSSVIIQVKDRGGVFPIDVCTIEFDENDGVYRITAVGEGRGYGLRVTEQDFREFFSKLSECRSDSN